MVSLLKHILHISFLKIFLSTSFTSYFIFSIILKISLNSCILCFFEYIPNTWNGRDSYSCVRIVCVFVFKWCVITITPPIFYYILTTFIFNIGLLSYLRSRKNKFIKIVFVVMFMYIMITNYKIMKYYNIKQSLVDLELVKELNVRKS